MPVAHISVQELQTINDDLGSNELRRLKLLRKMNLTPDISRVEFLSCAADQHSG